MWHLHFHLHPATGSVLDHVRGRKQDVLLSGPDEDPQNEETGSDDWNVLVWRKKTHTHTHIYYLIQFYFGLYLTQMYTKRSDMAQSVS